MTIESVVSADTLRGQMIERLAEVQRLGDETVRAFKQVPRHAFLPDVALDRVYSGNVIPTRFNDKGHPISSSSEVAVMTSMIDAMKVEAGQRILEIGAGTGYNAAVLAELVGERGRVVTVEIDAEIADEAKRRLEGCGYGRVDVVVGDGWDGWAAGAPFDRIELTASAFDLSPAWSEQLIDGGVLVVPFQFRPNAMAILALRKEGLSFQTNTVLPGGFMPLRGIGSPRDETRILGEWRLTTSQEIDDARITALLKTRPTVELAEGPSWASAALLAVLYPDSITIQKDEHPTVAMGIVDPSSLGLAVIEWGGGTIAGPRPMLVGLGEPAVLERLRTRVAELSHRSWGDVVVHVTPRGTSRPGGDIVFERDHYSFGLRVRGRAA